MADQPSGWDRVRKNVKPLGCHGDYAHYDPRLRDPKYYYRPQAVGKISGRSLRRFKQLEPKRIEGDQRFPTRRYTAYLDGPRVIESIDRKLKGEPATLTLDRALKRCYDLARSKNKRYFALQEGGKLCLGTNSTEFKKYSLPEDECRDKKKKKGSQGPGPNTGTKGGGEFTSSVFEIKDMDYEPEGAEEAEPEDEFSKFRYKVPNVKDEMSCEAPKNSFFDLSPSQLFMQHYFTINNPVKGVLTIHGAGSGKSALALNVIGNFMGKWRIIWVTRHSLRAVPLKNLYEDLAQVRIREIIDDQKPLTLASGEVLARTRDEKIAFIRSERGPAVLKRYGIEIEKQRIISYDEFVRMIAGKGADGQHLRDLQLGGSPSGDMGFKTLFVVDEAHNLTSTSLAADERVELDAEFPQGVEILGERFATKGDVYASYGSGDTRPITGRDLIAAMLWQSYRVSKANSAKVLLLTATPMSSSPVDLFWLMNLMLEKPEMRLSSNVADYYDPSSMKLNDDAVVKFARAAHGRVSYLNITQNPTTFARKIFFERMDSALHKFHQKIIDDAVEKERQKAEKAGTKVQWTRLVSIYQSLSIMAKTKGSFFDEYTLKTYEREMKRLEHWDPESERRHQTDLYHAEIDAARRTFKMEVRESDTAAYGRKAEQYRRWAQKHMTTAPTESFEDVVDSNGDLVPYDEWVAKPAAGAPISTDAAPKDVQKRYATLIKRKDAWEQKVRDGKRTRRPDMDNLLNEDGTVKTLEEFAKPQPRSRDRHEYEALKERFAAYKSALSTHDMASKSSRAKKEDLPERPSAVDEVMDEYGQLLPLSAWFDAKIAPKRAKKEKKRYSKTETRHLKFLIRDPASGLMRMRTLDEFVQVRDPMPSLEGKETRTGLSMLMWHRNFDANAFRDLMPYYAPKIHDCIENIIQLETDARATYGHGFKHMVFTFSTAGGKGGGADVVDARAVASAFHARSDLFRVCLVYKENDDGRFVLHTDIPSAGPDDHRWGVAMLASKSMPNIYAGEHGGNLTVEYNAKIVKATQAAWNDAKNRYGDLVKVCVLDGAYTEGVEVYDDNIAHFLNEGLSREQLEQASSRPVRFCRSKHIPFFKGVGAFMEMHFYAQADLNEQMLAHVPYEEQLNLNLMDVFKDLSAQFSIDYWLNQNVNDFRPVYRGVITSLYAKHKQIYVVQKALQSGETEIQYDFIVDPDSMVTRLRVGSQVVDLSERPGIVKRWNTEAAKFDVEFVDGSSELVRERDLRLTPGQEVEFTIPYGTDLAQKVMNIGNYNGMHPSDLAQDMVGDVSVPETALNVAATAFSADVTYALLGIVSMLRMIIKAGGAGVPIHMVLPDLDEGEGQTISNFSMRWTFYPSGERAVRIPYNMLRRFLKPTTGISLMFLTLQNTQNTDVSSDHVNVLVYVPQWGTVERFDPMGYVAHAFDCITLDARLHDMFAKEDATLQYMSTAETCPLFGIQRMQMKETRRKTMDSRSYCTVFSLFYMHMRILHAVDHLKQYPKEKRSVFPVQFQRGLIKTLQNAGRSGLTDYICGYAELAVQSRAFVTSWDQYDEAAPFWANTVRLIQILLRMASSRSVAGIGRTEPKPAHQQHRPGLFERLKALTALVGL